MRQAIETHFLPPTNHRGSRIVAKAEAGRITYDWDHALGIEENHRAAALQLAQKFAWPGQWIGGGLPGRGYAFVCCDD